MVAGGWSGGGPGVGGENEIGGSPWGRALCSQLRSSVGSARVKAAPAGEMDASSLQKQGSELRG